MERFLRTVTKNDGYFGVAGFSGYGWLRGAPAEHA